MTNSAYPDQVAKSEAEGSGSFLFADGGIFGFSRNSACIKGSLGIRDSQTLPWDFQKSMPGSLGLPTFKDMLSFITNI